MTKPHRIVTSSGVIRISDMEVIALEALSKATKPYGRMQKTCLKLCGKGYAEEVARKHRSHSAFRITDVGRQLYERHVRPLRQPRYFGPTSEANPF